MDKTERIIMAIALFGVVISTLALLSAVNKAHHRIDALEVRLQNMEHLISLSLSESRSSVPIGPTNGLPAFAPAPRKRSDSKIK